MAITHAPDLTTDFPRSGRDLLGGYAFLARVIDKARAHAAGTQGEYLAYCPFSMGFLERCGISKDAFESMIQRNASDADFVAYFDEHVTPAQKQTANQWVLHDMKPHLDEEDEEEGRT